MAYADFQCPECSSNVYDNREGKKNPRAPDFRCSSCDWVRWPPRGQKAAGAQPRAIARQYGAPSQPTAPELTPRQYLMQCANLLQLCHNAARAVIGDDYDREDARTLFIAASRAGMIAKMPMKPLPPPEPEPEQEMEPGIVEINGQNEEEF